jgi:isopentenyldiphosphate isomerase
MIRVAARIPPVGREELLNVYDDQGRVIDAQPRRAAKASGRAVGAVNVLIVNAAGEVLLQRRPGDKENAGRWDKSVGGHVSAGEEFDVTAVREASEELFDRPRTPQVVLAPEHGFAATLENHDPHSHVVLRRVGLQLGLRDVRLAPGGQGLRNVTYHVAIYHGRSDLAREAFHPQATEIAELAWTPAAVVDERLLRGELAPNMAFLWLTQARALLALVGAA